MHRLLALVVATAAALPAQNYSHWTELGDAGDRIDNANITHGPGPLERIDGVLGPGSPTAFDVDLYLIRVDDPASFRASTIGGATFDTQLWMFDRGGNGIAFRDDDPGSLQSTLTGQFLSGPGLVLLGVSHYDNDAHDQGFQQLWLDQPYTVERQPDGPASGPLFQWNANSFNTTGGPYSIFLSGATYARPASLQVPEVAWARVEPQPFSGPNTFLPDLRWQHTPSGELVHVNHTGVGIYEVLFPGSLTNPESHFQASALGGNHAVVIQNWITQNGKLTCNVTVFDATGALADAGFTLRYRSYGLASDQAAFLFADNATASIYTARTDYSWNGNRPHPMVQRVATGFYYVQLPGLAANFTGGTLSVTPFSGAANIQFVRATIEDWSASFPTTPNDLLVIVKTRDANNNPLDSRFTLSFDERPGTALSNLGSGAYHYCDQESAAVSYGPAGYSNSNGAEGTPTPQVVTRVGVGQYQVWLPNVAPANSSIATVSAVASTSGGSASIQDWGPHANGGTSVEVRTYDSAGGAADGKFLLDYSTDGPARGAAQTRIVGRGCGDLTLLTDTRPVLGSQWVLFALTPAYTPTLVALGLNNPNLPLAALGAPGCTLYQDLLATYLSNSGFPVAMQIGSSPALIGFTIYAQAATTAAGVNQLGVFSSNGVVGTVGVQ